MADSDKLENTTNITTTNDEYTPALLMLPNGNVRHVSVRHQRYHSAREAATRLADGHTAWVRPQDEAEVRRLLYGPGD